MAPSSTWLHFMEEIMAWTTPVVTEVCIGMEVTSYESASI
ncbi:pyrroloquinoline quinone precursor peptide PqqA [Lichenifustis flavocetrariae]|uniref:Coenzyme PQQ synthesis protein A n=1 Tax=Lichenifustis flavocetrariae TaxID=2949735 RepID=A0AA42CHY9_9HYPH|nr:pyrroloquinoline quinone precursor peptide PqqA [Lichenifustis flavocetrariae]MCW6507789.1 pyrroloquinoline quinone precursor peptide PqqA [Lichenifustis flavocetrariae]